MARRTVGELPDEDARVGIEIVHSDFRDFDPGERRFDLITGSPPYFPLGTGVLPDDSQRRACRFEARGGVEAYCETAARCLAPGARFYLVFQTAGDSRVLDAARSASLHVGARADITMREGRSDPFLTVYEFCREPVLEVEQVRFAVRDIDGAITDEYRSARRALGVE